MFKQCHHNNGYLPSHDGKSRITKAKSVNERCMWLLQGSSINYLSMKVTSSCC